MARKPQIVLSSLDVDRIEALIAAMPASVFPGKEFCLTLVYPRDMDGSADKISILAPVGSALLGLAVGDELAWPGPGGKAMTVQVKEIVYQPESSGELHR